MKTILVTGASGFLGWNVCRFSPEKLRLIGVWKENKDRVLPGLESYECDLVKKDAVWRMLKEVKPAAVFHLAAYSDTNFCEKKPDQTKALNVGAVETLAEMCAERDVRLLFTSSEQVFDGLQENYNEADAPAPGNEYGRQKLEAETAIREIYPDAAIVRISVLFGHTGNTARCFLQQWLDAWQKMLPVTAFNDEIRSFLSVRSAANALYLLWQKDASGIFHVGGATPLSRYDFAQMAKHTFRLPAAPLISRSQKEVELPSYRPPRLVMSNSKITELGFSAEEAEAALQSLAKEINVNTSLSLN